MDKIERRISPEAVTGFKRVGRNAAFVITEDLEMIQQIRVVTLDEHDVPIGERIASDPNLTTAQKEKVLARYQDQIVTKQTAGAFVNPTTGQVVPAGTEGAIKQSQFLQMITPKMLRQMGLPITDDTPILQTVYWMLAQEIEHIDARGDL
jgi:hypothetical protein